MKRFILKFGVISGLIMAAGLFVTIPFADDLGDKGAILGYTMMFLAFLLVFFGVRAYRDQVGSGAISFGRAFRVGISIMALASCFYVATWEIVYHAFFPDFASKYSAAQVEKAKKSGMTEAQVAIVQKQMDDFQKLYANPLANIALTFLEPLPVGVVMTLVSAAMLKRKATGSLA